MGCCTMVSNLFFFFFFFLKKNQMNDSCLLAIYAKVWSAGLMGKIFALRCRDCSSYNMDTELRGYLDFFV